MNKDSDGFSLVELTVAMGITLVLLGISSTMLGGSWNIRRREDQRSAAIADAQRALNIMTREIANAGVGLNDNGIVADSGDSGLTSIRIRANLDAFYGSTDAGGEGEDIRYILYPDGNDIYLARYDRFASSASMQTTVLANRLDNLKIRYYSQRVDYTTNTSNCDIQGISGATLPAEVSPSVAKYIVLSLCVELPAVGREGDPGHQPESVVQLTSDVILRNSKLLSY
jgi:type II secretory pathway pseudopilin PulG